MSSNAAFASIDETINWLSGDFNGDGFEDVLRQKKESVVDAVNGVQFFLGTTGGGFQAPVNVANMPSMQGNVVNLIAGDFNGDGRTDLIRQEKGAWVDAVSMMLQRRSPLFSPPPKSHFTMRDRSPCAIRLLIPYSLVVG